MWPPATSNFWLGEFVPIPTLLLLSTYKVLLGVAASIKNGVVVFVASNTIKLSPVFVPATNSCTSFLNLICALLFVLDD